MSLRPTLWYRLSFLVAASLLSPLATFAQTTLTGAVEFTTDNNGNASNCLIYNTLADNYDDLWLALDANATSPVNGPTDAQSPISIPLQTGSKYKFYIFGDPGTCSTAYGGLNLFFDGDPSTPGISVFGPINTTEYQPDANTTYSLPIGQVKGSGTNFHRSGKVIVFLDGYTWNTPDTPPGDVCRSNPYSFTPDPDGAADHFGSFSLQVYPAANLTIAPSSGPPLHPLTVSGADFAPAENVKITIESLQNNLVAQVTTDANGAFSVSIQEPQAPFNSVIEFFALGQTSGKLGIKNITVTPAVVAPAGTVAAGAGTSVVGLGFGAGENVSVYLDDPRSLLTTGVANGAGSFKAKITIPPGTPSGPNGLLAIGQTTGAVGIGKITIQ